jgi:hypothetical protein
VLSELLEDPSRKIVIFSEWVKMLALVRELADEMGVDYAWHTGDVPQLKRRAEIARFLLVVYSSPRMRVRPVSTFRWRTPSSILICPGIRQNLNNASRALGARAREAW